MELRPSDSPSLDDWIDVAEEHPTLKRQMMSDCRSGKLKGQKVHRHWLVRRRDRDAWVESHVVRGETKEADPNVSYMDAARARIGLKRRTG